MKLYKLLPSLTLTCTLLLSACSGMTADVSRQSEDTSLITQTQQSENTSQSTDVLQSTDVPQNTQDSQTTKTSQTVEQSHSSAEIQTQSLQETQNIQSDGTLYIGTSENFKEYPFTGEKTPDHLIEAIADLTGWNLTLADPVTNGKGGMTVCFTKDCSIFTGPPQVQKDDFFAYDNISLAQMILDSIEKTLQENYVDRQAGGDPSNLDIYFCVMDNGNISDLVIPEENITVPMDQPYQGLITE